MFSGFRGLFEAVPGRRGHLPVGGWVLALDEVFSVQGFRILGSGFGGSGGFLHTVLTTNSPN